MITPSRILLVQGKADQARLVRQALESVGHTVTHAATGREGLALLRTGSIDLILLASELPDLPAEEVCRQLRGQDVAAAIPVMMLTVASGRGAPPPGLEVDADDCVPLPCSPAELLARVYACLRTRSLQEELRETQHRLRATQAQLPAARDPGAESPLAHSLRHALNNPLSVIGVQVELLLDRGTHLGEEAVRRVETIRRMVERMEKILGVPGPGVSASGPSGEGSRTPP